MQSIGTVSQVPHPQAPCGFAVASPPPPFFQLSEASQCGNLSVGHASWIMACDEIFMGVHEISWDFMGFYEIFPNAGFFAEKKNMIKRTKKIQ